MKKNHRLLTFAATAAALISLSACGGKNETDALYEKLRVETDPYRRGLLTGYIEQVRLADAGKRFDADRALATAVILKYPDHIRRFIGEGANPNVSFGGMPLLFSAMFVARDVGIAETLIAAGADVNAFSPKGATPLTALVSAAAGTPENPDDGNAGLDAGTRERFIRLVLEKGADVNAVDAEGNSALLLAVEKKDAATAALLLDRGAALDAGRQRTTPLILAAQVGVPAIAETILAHGADVNAPHGGKTALRVALENGDFAFADVLARHGADVSDAATLAAFVESGNVPAVEYLIGKGADVNARHNGVPVVAFAAKAGNLELVKRLAQAGADTSAALAYFVEREDAAAVDFLLKQGANAKVAVSASGEPAVVLAARRGNAELTRRLVSAGATATPALPYFVEKQDAGTVSFLLESGADADAVSASGEPVVVLAASVGNAEIARMLVAQGANPTLALPHFVKARNEDAVAYLLSRKADANALLGDVPVVLFAARAGAVGIVRRLVDAGADATIVLPIFVEDKDVETVEFLRRRNADPTGVKGIVPLIAVAAKNKDLGMVDLLVRRGANPTLALPQFLRNQDVDGTAYLLKNGADARAVVDGVPAVVSAAETGNFNLVKLLVDGGADPTLALPSAVAKRDARSVAYLLDRGADANALCGDVPAVLVAAKAHDAEIVRSLVARGADATLALPYFTGQNDDDVAAFLLERGADPNASVNGVPAVVFAADRGNFTLVRRLVEKGADATLALPPFIEKQDRRVAEDLLNLRASPNVRVAGVPAVVFAAQNGNGALVKLLVERGADATLALPYFVKARNNQMVTFLLDSNGDPNAFAGPLSANVRASLRKADPEPVPAPAPKQEAPKSVPAVVATEPQPAPVPAAEPAPEPEPVPVKQPDPEPAKAATPPPAETAKSAPAETQEKKKTEYQPPKKRTRRTYR